MADFLVNLGIPLELVVIVVAALPIFELRGAIPLALFTFDMPWYTAFPLAFIGNMLPIPFILLLSTRIMRWLGRIGLFRRFFDWLCTRTRRRSEKLLQRQYIGLIAFVGIPLPFTGAWTGSLGAVLLDFKFIPAILSIAAGVLIAGVVVTAFCLLGWQTWLFIST
ncbi:MAG: small multi-drug export protein [Dehalococcoidia bacterium]|nr:small multi-drug export protein [Dehalococcoidia bacterium]